MPSAADAAPDWGLGLAVLLASGAVGAFLGWLIGASETPVVAAVIPLVFGLTGVLWQRYSAIRERVATALAVESTVGAERALDVMRGSAALASPSGAPTDPVRRAAMLTAFAVTAFVGAAFMGLQRGLDARVPRLPGLATLVAGDTTLSFREAATLTRLRLDLAAMRLTPEELTEVFQSAVLPVLGRAEFRPGGELHEGRVDALAYVAQQLTRTAVPRAAGGRNPASVPPPQPDTNTSARNDSTKP